MSCNSNAYTQLDCTNPNSETCPQRCPPGCRCSQGGECPPSYALNHCQSEAQPVESGNRASPPTSEASSRSRIDDFLVVPPKPSSDQPGPESIQDDSRPGSSPTTRSQLRLQRQLALLTIYTTTMLFLGVFYYAMFGRLPTVSHRPHPSNRDLPFEYVQLAWVGQLLFGTFVFTAIGFWLIVTV